MVEKLLLDESDMVLLVEDATGAEQKWPRVAFDKGQLPGWSVPGRHVKRAAHTPRTLVEETR